MDAPTRWPIAITPRVDTTPRRPIAITPRPIGGTSGAVALCRKGADLALEAISLT